MRAPPVKARSFVVRVVVPLPPWMLRVPAQRIPFAAIVKVTVDAPELNMTLPPNSGVWLAKVIVCQDDALKVIEAAKLHAAEVDTFVHAPEIVHTPAPVAVIYPAGLLTFALPAPRAVDAFVGTPPAARPSVT